MGERAVSYLRHIFTRRRELSQALGMGRSIATHGHWEINEWPIPLPNGGSSTPGLFEPRECSVAMQILIQLNPRESENKRVRSKNRPRNKRLNGLHNSPKWRMGQLI